MSTEEQIETQSEAAPEATESVGSASLLDEAIKATKQTEPDDAKKMIETLIAEVNRGVVKFDKNIIHTIDNMRQGIDKVLSTQLAEVMHHPKFQKLEGSWRGLQYLCKNSETGDQLKLKVLNCSKRELAKDLASASAFDQSSVWKQIYEDEFGMPGGQPYGALVGDYEMRNHPEDIKLLEDMSSIAAGSFAPFITSPDPTLFGLENWQGLPKLKDLKTTFDATEYAKWKSFRDSEDARFVVMAMPRTLARYPYGGNTQQVEEFDFEELPLNRAGESVAVGHEDYCWMNTAYVLGTKLTQAFAETNWCTRIRGRNSGGAVEGLSTYAFKTADGDTVLNCPTEVPITDRREKELSDLGFMPLSYYKGTDYAVFFGGQTVQKPKQYDEADATANAAISARLPYMMASSRIAHYLKVMVRDHIGSFKEAPDLENFLNKWIRQYKTDDPSPNEDIKARFPLAEAEIKVSTIPGMPGSYNAVARLRPWLQLEELNTSVRMVARIDKK